MPARFLRTAAFLLLVLPSSAWAEIKQLTIVHLNDLHARLLPDDRGQGGFAHVATAIAEERATATNVVVLHAGDMVQGSPVSTIFEGTPVFEVGNHLGIDAHCLGNHEFDYGWERIRDFTRTSNAPILSANVVNERGEHLVPPSAVLQAGDLRVGVIGALTPVLPALTKASRLGPWRADPLTEVLRDAVRRIERQSDIVVVLGHLFDREDEVVLRTVPGVDVLVSGHNHGGRDRALVVDGRICVKLRPYGREIGRLDLDLDTSDGRVVGHRWKRIPVSSTKYPPDAAAAAAVDLWESRVSERVDVPIGHCDRPLGRSAVQALVERALREVTGADLAYMNRGGVRDSLSEGVVLARHFWNILPFDNEIVEARVAGRDLPEEVAEGRGVEPERIYRFVTNDYVAGLAAYRGMRFRPTGSVLRELVVDWVRERDRVP